MLCAREIRPRIRRLQADRRTGGVRSHPTSGSVRAAALERKIRLPDPRLTAGGIDFERMRSPGRKPKLICEDRFVDVALSKGSGAVGNPIGGRRFLPGFKVVIA